MQGRPVARALADCFQISLRIRHPSIDPAEISRVLGLEPEEAFAAGQRRRMRSSSAAPRVHSETVWVGNLDPTALEEPVVPQDPGWARIERHLRVHAGHHLDVALATMCLRLRAKHAEFLKRIDDEGGRISLLVTVSPKLVTTFTLLPEMARAVSDLRISLEFEFADA
jgi:hypothetical protein